MEFIAAIMLIAVGIIIIWNTFNRCRKIENKFSVAYFMCVSGYGAGIGCIAIGANILVT